MERRTTSIITMSVLALALVGLGILSDFWGACPSNEECYGSLGLFIAPVIAIIGVVVGLLSLIITVRDALGRGDRASGMLLTLCVALSIGAIVHLYTVALMSITRVDQQVGSRPSLGLMLLQAFFASSPIGWNIAAYAAPAVFALLYIWLPARRVLRLSALGGSSALLVILLLIVAPLWSAFQASHRPPALQIVGAVGLADCAHGMYPSIIVQNVGDGTLRWTATKVYSPPAVSIQPSSGSIGPGGSQTVMLVGGDYLPTPDTGQGINIKFDSNGGDQIEYIMCQTPNGMLRVTPTSITTTWRVAVLPLITVTNIGQHDALWSATTTQPGPTISPQTGALHPGQSQAVAVYDGNLGSVCGNPGKPEFTILFYGGPQALTVTVTVTCP